MDCETWSRTQPGPDGVPWLKVTLDRVYCVQRIVREKCTGSHRYTWTCSSVDCSTCEGTYCSDFSLTVYSEGPTPDNLPPASEFKYGDSVKLQREKGIDSFRLFEISIVGKQGEITFRDLRSGTVTTPTHRVVMSFGNQ